MIKKIVDYKNPKYGIITPLKSGDKISKITKITVKRNKLPFVWYYIEDKLNRPKNLMKAINTLKDELPNYLFLLDNDIELSRRCIDNLYNVLNNSRNDVAYSYCGFEYKGQVNQKFPAIPFDANKLRQSNYISSNSMFKKEILLNIPLVTDDKMVRLLDWAYLLKLLNNGYIGEPDYKSYFTAHTDKKGISARNQDDYKKKYLMVYERFVKNGEK